MPGAHCLYLTTLAPNLLHYQLMKQLLTVILTAIALISATGCGTIMHGTEQDIAISSNPTGGSVTIDGKPRGKTPATVALSRSDKHIVKIELEGYMPYEMALTSSVSGWVWGNIVFGGLIGLAVDAASGGMYELNPEQVRGEMRKNDVSMVNKDGMFLTVVLKADPAWKKVGELTKAE
jgi:hypothetical protein